jgi:hypothetical protein
MCLVYLKLIGGSGTFLKPESAGKAPHTILIALSVFSMLGNYMGKGDSGSIMVVMNQDGCSYVKLNPYRIQTGKVLIKIPILEWDTETQRLDIFPKST